PLANASLVLVMLVSNIIIERAKLQIDSNKPTLSFAQHRIYRRRMGHALGLMTLGFVIVITPLIIPMVYPDAEWTTALMRTAAPIVFVFSLVMCLPPVLAYVFSGQGGCKIKIDLPDEGASLGEVSASSAPKIAGRGDDKYWIWGMFYCNPDDPALFIEDRFGSNISLNYSRLSAKIFVGVTAVVLVGTYVWATVMLLAA
ncbi:MAG: hypothetical protein FWF80_00335, partial [Defluviitaleaceae bacterium]|nr:hypothetical protein [Defluviitaleaceae bacterium]